MTSSVLRITSVTPMRVQHVLCHLVRCFYLPSPTLGIYRSHWPLVQQQFPLFTMLIRHVSGLRCMFATMRVVHRFLVMSIRTSSIGWWENDIRWAWFGLIVKIVCWLWSGIVLAVEAHERLFCLLHARRQLVVFGQLDSWLRISFFSQWNSLLFTICLQCFPFYLVLSLLPWEMRENKSSCFLFSWARTFSSEHIHCYHPFLSSIHSYPP